MFTIKKNKTGKTGHKAHENCQLQCRNPNIYLDVNKQDGHLLPGN
jgi:hypothetical protein